DSYAPTSLISSRSGGKRPVRSTRTVERSFCWVNLSEMCLLECSRPLVMRAIPCDYWRPKVVLLTMVLWRCIHTSRRSSARTRLCTSGHMVQQNLCRENRLVYLRNVGLID